MKTITLKLTDRAFKSIRGEAMAHFLAHTDGMSLVAYFTGRVVKAIEEGEDELVLRHRDDPDEDPRTVHIYERFSEDDAYWMVDPPGGLHDTAEVALNWVRRRDARSKRHSTIVWHTETEEGRDAVAALEEKGA